MKRHMTTRRGMMAAAPALYAGLIWSAPARAAGFGRVRRVASGLAYGENRRQRMDVYAPVAAGSYPVLVLFHGEGGHEDALRRQSRQAAGLARQGFVVAVADYPAMDAGGFPVSTADAAVATCVAARHAATFGGDPGRLGVLGRGAGAYLALMIALDRRYMSAVGRYGLIRAAAGLAGVYRSSTPDLTLTCPTTFMDSHDAPPVRTWPGDLPHELASVADFFRSRVRASATSALKGAAG